MADNAKTSSAPSHKIRGYKVTASIFERDITTKDGKQTRAAMADDQNIADVLAKGIAREGMKMPVPADSIIGRWAGDPVYLIGDYDESGLYQRATDSYTSISEPLVEVWNSFLGENSLRIDYRPCSTCSGE
jgi:hypothetical protein